MADVNGKIVNGPVLNYSTISQPVLSKDVAPISGVTVSRGSVLEKKKVDSKTVDFDMVPTKTVRYEFLFRNVRRRIKSPVATSVVSEPSANTNPHVIPMSTSQGQQEIKDEFHK